jgi:hypothetical protein
MYDQVVEGQAVSLEVAQEEYGEELPDYTDPEVLGALTAAQSLAALETIRWTISVYESDHRDIMLPYLRLIEADRKLDELLKSQVKAGGESLAGQWLSAKLVPQKSHVIDPAGLRILAPGIAKQTITEVVDAKLALKLAAMANIDISGITTVIEKQSCRIDATKTMRPR